MVNKSINMIEIQWDTKKVGRDDLAVESEYSQRDLFRHKIFLLAGFYARFIADNTAVG